MEAKNGRFSAGNTRGYSHYVESVIQNSGIYKNYFLSIKINSTKYKCLPLLKEEEEH